MVNSNELSTVQMIAGSECRYLILLTIKMGSQCRNSDRRATIRVCQFSKFANSDRAIAEQMLRGVEAI